MTSNSGLFNRRFADNFIPQPANTSLEIGQIAPDFELPRVQGDPVRLSDYRGQKPVVLAFTRIFTEKLFCPFCYPPHPRAESPLQGDPSLGGRAADGHQH
jgi:hypothetical protein